MPSFPQSFQFLKIYFKLFKSVDILKIKNGNVYIPKKVFTAIEKYAILP